MENEDLFRKVRNILNKLTPTSLNKFTNDLLDLPINTQEHLEGIVEIIFEKSLNEHVYMKTYAQLCKHLSSLSVSTLSFR